MNIAPDLRGLLDALDEPALLVRLRQVLAANGPARELLGRDIEGSDVRLAIRQPAALERILSRTVASVEVAGIGSPEWPWLLIVRPLPPDLTLVRLIDRSATRAAEKMRVDFVANASHELRTPLANLLGYAEALRDRRAEMDEATRDRFVSVIHEEAQRMQRLVEDLISLSRIESERFKPPREPLDMNELVEEAVSHWRRLAEERSSELLVDAQPGLPVTRGDRDQILQLLDNLVSNALRYGRAGTPVRISIQKGDGVLQLTVSDEGEGIPADHIPRVTERFYRVDKARSRASGGTGLGLSIVKHIVERHRGRLDIQSTVGRGTDVHVLLPAERP